MNSTWIALAAFAVSLCSLLISFDLWLRSFRPIVSLAVKTNRAVSGVTITYDLVIMNSGTLPARSIKLTAVEQSLAAALGADASEDNKQRWLACFNQEILSLQNNDRTSCSFGTTEANDRGFWKYGATVSINLTYRGWFGRSIYRESQTIQITDSESFTGYFWGPGKGA